ncbi:MAG: YdcF family protein [Nitrospiraceae bacterium]
MDMSPFFFGLYKLAKFAVYPFTWLFVLLGFLTLLIVLPVSPRRLRWIRILAASAFLLAFLFGNPVAADTLAGLLEQQAPLLDSSSIKRFDAIVVLGGGAAGKGTLRPSDELSDLSMKRTICGVDLFAHGFAPRILFSGGDASVFGSGPKEALEMKRLARRLGVPDEAILIEDQSRTTYENAVATKRLIGSASILLVTSASHIPRALGLFRKQGLDATPSPCGYTVKNRPGDNLGGNPFDLLPDVRALSKSTKAIVELVGILVYRVTGKL